LEDQVCGEKPCGKKYDADTKCSLSNVSVVRERRYIEIHYYY
jgi:hypothetical protein